MAAISHHSVPNFYLKKFRGTSLPEYKIWQYEIGKAPRIVPTVRATAIEHYNTALLSATHSFDSDAFEAALSRYESKAAMLFERIESRDFKASEKEDFARWMSIQMTRVPCFRDWVLDEVTRADPALTDYLIDELLSCPWCGAAITEKTLVNWEHSDSK